MATEAPPAPPVHREDARHTEAFLQTMYGPFLPLSFVSGQRYSSEGRSHVHALALPDELKAFSN